MKFPTKTLLIFALLSRLAVTRTNASVCRGATDDNTIWDMTSCVRKIVLTDNISQFMMQKCLLGCYYTAIGFMGIDGDIKFDKFDEVVDTIEDVAKLKVEFYDCFKLVREDLSDMLLPCEAANCLEQLKPVRNYIENLAISRNTHAFDKDRSRTPPELRERQLLAAENDEMVKDEKKDAVMEDIRRMLSNQLPNPFLGVAMQDFPASTEVPIERAGDKELELK